MLEKASVLIMCANVPCQWLLFYALLVVIVLRTRQAPVLEKASVLMTCVSVPCRWLLFYALLVVSVLS